MQLLIDLFVSDALAMAPREGGQGGQGGLMDLMFPLLLMFGVMYFLIIRPQKRQAQQHRDFVNSLSKGDDVVTSGGIHGRVTGIADNVVTLEIANGVRIKVTKSHISRVPQAPTGSKDKKDTPVKAVNSK